MSPICLEPRVFVLRETVVYAVWFVLHAPVCAVWWAVSNTLSCPPDCSHRCM